MNIRNEIKAIIVRESMTMTEVVEKMADQYSQGTRVSRFAGLTHGMERKRPEPVGQVAAELPALPRSGGTGRRAGLCDNGVIKAKKCSKYEKLAEHTESKRIPLISHESYNKLYHLSTIKQPP